MPARTYRLGDIVLDRYLPDADEPTRGAARSHYRRFVAALLKVAVRQAEEERAAGDSPKTDRRPTIPNIP